MDLSKYSFEDCLLAALKSEIDSQALYSTLAEHIDNVFLKDRLHFLADEERKHEAVFRSWYQREFSTEEIDIPEESPVPLPEIDIKNQRVQVSEVLMQAMEAEKAAQDFYLSIAQQLEKDDERRRALTYIASMERSHFNILEMELENVNELESTHIEWPMMHLGP